MEAVNYSLKDRISEDLDYLFEQDKEFRDIFYAWVEQEFYFSKDGWNELTSNKFDELYYLLSEDYLEEVYYTGVKSCALYIMQEKEAVCK